MARSSAAVKSELWSRNGRRSSWRAAQICRHDRRRRLGRLGRLALAMRAASCSLPIREAILLSDGMAITLSDDQSLPLSELVIEVSFRHAPAAPRQAEVNQATILTFARNALTAQIEAITKAYGPIPHEIQ